MDEVRKKIAEAEATQPKPHSERMETMRPIGMHVRFDGPFDEAIEKVTDALKTEGFGILTDRSATLDRTGRSRSLCQPPSSAIATSQGPVAPPLTCLRPKKLRRHEYFATTAAAYASQGSKTRARLANASRSIRGRLGAGRRMVLPIAA